MRDTLINLALYQTGWFAMVLGAARGYPWAGAAAGLTLLTCHLLLVRERKPEILTVIFIGILGTLADSIQAHAGVFVFESGYWSYRVVPLWLTVMWMQFATLFHFALEWLSGRYLLSAVLGALGGPAAFWTGERLGGVIFPMGNLHSLLILATAWFVLLPLCVLVAERFQPQGKTARYRI